MQTLDWKTLNPSAREAALKRPDIITDSSTAGIVSNILERVKAEGDSALIALTEQFDGAMPANWQLDRNVMAAAADRLAPELKQAIDGAIENIACFHSAQKSESLTVETAPGITCELRSEPLEKVGLYVSRWNRTAYQHSFDAGTSGKDCRVFRENHGYTTAG